MGDECPEAPVVWRTIHDGRTDSVLRGIHESVFRHRNTVAIASGYARSDIPSMGTVRALVLFGSTTGTTRILAGAAKKGLLAAGLDVVVRNAFGARVSDLRGFPVILAGCSTWEDGRLQRDFGRLVAELGDLRLDGVLAGIFGAGSKSYPKFCRAVDVLESEFTGRGARLVLPSFRLDGSPYAIRGTVQSWAEGVRTYL